MHIIHHLMQTADNMWGYMLDGHLAVGFAVDETIEVAFEFMLGRLRRFFFAGSSATQREILPKLLKKCIGTLRR